MTWKTSLFGAIILFTCVCNNADQLSIDIDTDNAVFQIPRHFLSLAGTPKTPIHDPEEFHRMLNSERFLALVRGLSPSYWRYGGREAQSVTFHYSQSDCPSDGEKKREISLCLTAKIFDEIYGLAMKTKTMLIYDLNDLARLENGTWDSRNVRELVNYTIAMNYNVTWQLGNGMEV